MSKKSFFVYSTALALGCGNLAFVPTASAFNFMNPGDWFGGNDRHHRYYDDDYYYGRRGYGPGWGGYGPGWGGYGPGWGGYGPYGYGLPGYGYGLNPGANQSKSETKPPPVPE